MKQEPVPGGYILLARKTCKSVIMEKPPLYMKLWSWMLLQASFKNHGNLKRGQFFTSLGKMRKAMAHKVGYGDRYFYCRACWGLAYPVENENSFSRLVRKAKGVRAQMRYDRDLLKPLRYSRPKGMHWGKYMGLLYKALSVEEAIWSHLDRNHVETSQR